MPQKSNSGGIHLADCVNLYEVCAFWRALNPCDMLLLNSFAASSPST
jgi:hypothetical protein